MLQRNSRVTIGLVVLFLFSLGAVAQDTTTAPRRLLAAPNPLRLRPLRPLRAPGRRATAGTAAAPPSGQEPGTDSGTFVFRSDVEEVVLRRYGGDDKQHIITSLDRTLLRFLRTVNLRSSSHFATKTYPSRLES